MGKKMGINTKSVAAKERKNEKAAADKAAKDKAIEDAKWVDDDKNLAKKQVRFNINFMMIISNYWLTFRPRRMMRRREDKKH